MRISRQQRTRNERGVTYLMLMFVIVLIGIATTAAAKQWKTIVQREREADLLAKGIEIQNALALYSATIKAGRVMPGEVYPQTSRDYPNLSCARSILTQWGLENGNIFGRRQAASWGFEARAGQGHFDRKIFPFQSGISRGAPPIVIGSSNIQVPHRFRSCHKGLCPVLGYPRCRDRRALLAEALQFPSQLRGSRP
jgi:type II secretory pathway pseudopilin PulG